MTLGQNIQTARRAKNMSQEALAAQIGVSRQALGKWEKDTALPGLENLQALATALGTSADGLLGITPQQPPRPALTLDAMSALLDAREAAARAARRRWLAVGVAAGVLLALALAAFAVQYNRLAADTASQLAGLQGQVSANQGTLGSLNAQLDELKTAVQKGESTVAEWGWQPLDALQTASEPQWMPVEVWVIPRTATTGMTGELVLDTIGGVYDQIETVPLTAGAAGRYTAQTKFVVGDTPALSVRWTAADGAVTTEPLDTVYFTEEDVTPRFVQVVDDGLAWGYRHEGETLSLTSLPAQVELETPAWMEIHDPALTLYLGDSATPAAAPLLGLDGSPNISGGTCQATFPDETYPYQGGQVWMVATFTDQTGKAWRSEEMVLEEKR